ncbi:alkaline phosphatase family protein [Oceanobacillus chungangensis]|uniref:Nucleotide pyrophosphatase n=1 Tax=Oceanobacillus chungangensis TaxID=1229152 RepID=A0A3D8PH03_9BACI|nr:alkaline phosphatase family protein [Oceanobacillus chungangensis]RDW15364.1 nucleotide pyrophosphatase [Oceanobacillus chungangensis]
MSNKKVIMITLDGCRYDIAIQQLGFLNHFVEKNLASRYKVISETPSNSRPLYEVLLTGVPTHENGIYTNYNVQMSKEQSIFSLMKDAGKTTAAAAYNWVSELYNRAPFSMFEDRIQHDETKAIQHGIFYSDDTYPDSHLFADAHALITSTNPDFMYVHSMNIDDIGHKYTGNSIEYRSAVTRVDTILGIYVPRWLEMGYQVIVTSDHGMDDFGNHGGTLLEHREVPLFIFSDQLEPRIGTKPLEQLQLAPLVCHLLGIEKGKKMQEIDWQNLNEGVITLENGKI